MNRFRKIKQRIPASISHILSYLIYFLRQSIRLLKILLSKFPTNQISIYYGFDHVPRHDEISHGGIVKFQWMQNYFPNSPGRFNILYLVSSRIPNDWQQLLWIARKKGGRLVWNQDGVAYPGWHGSGWEKINESMVKLIHEADYVFYQSQFCKVSADRFLGKRNYSYDILYNPVDTKFFIPADSDPDPHHLTLLLGGTQYQYYRLESAIHTLAVVSRYRSDVRLLVTGRLCWKPDESAAYRIAMGLAHDLCVADRIMFLGPYTQKNAPAVFQKAHILLHTKYNDPCPSIILEAMACGLPVAYSESGGVPELVGAEAGSGVSTELSWEHDFPPDPGALANAVMQIAARRVQYAEAARQRAVQHFDLQPWLKRHKEIFEELVSK